MKHIDAIANAVCRMAEGLQKNPLGSVILVLLASCAVAAGWSWRH